LTDIVAPKTTLPIIKEDGTMTQRFRDWTQFITRQVNFSTEATGSGTPEGVLASTAGKFYRDTAGPNLYWKSVDDVATDTTMGWLLVV